MELSGTLKNKDTFVLYHTQANEDIKSKGDLANATVINSNGDDAVVLKKDDTVIDSIGQVGTRVETLKDISLVRNTDIVHGDPIIDEAFDPRVEWTAFPKDDTSNLGIHGSSTENSADPENPLEIISIADARSKPLGDTLNIKGVVTDNLKNTIQVQDAASGIAVRPANLDANIGDEVTLTGKLSDYHGLLQLDETRMIEKTENIGAPSPKNVSGAQVSEINESQLVTTKKIQILSVESGSNWANYTATDGTINLSYVMKETN